MNDEDDELKVSLERLIEQEDRIRALALRLLRDPDEADDAVQDLMLDAAQRATGPDALAPDDGRSWPRSVANVVRGKRRADQRRRRRERIGAKPEARPSALDEVVADESRRELVRAVMALDEPYRSVVVLRYFDGLPPREIVQKTGAPLETVKKQLQRALGQLRSRLDSRMGPERPWAILALPSAIRRRRSTVAVPSKGISSKLVVVGVGLVVALTAVLVQLESGRSKGSVGESNGVDETELGQRPPATGDLTTSDDDETNSRSPANDNAADSPVEAAPEGSRSDSQSSAARPAGRYDPPFRGRVVDAEGRVVAPSVRDRLRFEFRYSDEAARVHGDPTVIRLRCDDDGWIESAMVPRSPLLSQGRLVAVAGPLSVLAIGFEREDSLESRIVVLPAVRVAGTVVDANGRPAEQVIVSLTADLDTLGTYPGGLSTDTHAGPAPVITDALGRFDLGSVPRSTRFSLIAGRAETGAVRVALPESDRTDLVLRLAPPAPAPSAAFITGVVVGPGGRRVPGATVHLGWLSGLSDEDGEFRLETSTSTLEMIRSNGHHLSAVTEDGRFGRTSFGGQSHYQLIVPDQMEKLGGRIIDPAGSPMPGVRVSVLDGTPKGSSPRSLEDGPGDRVERTDASGSFELPFMERRPYTLRFIREDPFFVLDVEALVPGTSGLRVQVPPDHVVERARGRALGPRGEPIAGVQVRALAYPTTSGGSFLAAKGPATRTDAEGWFELSNLPRRGAFVEFDPRPNDGRTGELRAVEDLDVDALPTVVLDLECEVSPTLREGAIGARLRFLDGDGSPVRVTRVVPGGIRIEPEVTQLADGSFGLLLLPASTPRAEVLSADGERMRSVELDLNPMQPVHPEL